jgi:hypothetical protein
MKEHHAGINRGSKEDKEAWINRSGKDWNSTEVI